MDCSSCCCPTVNVGGYIQAVLDRNLAENISRVLYPNDNVSGFTAALLIYLNLYFVHMNQWMVLCVTLRVFAHLLSHTYELQRHPILNP